MNGLAQRLQQVCQAHFEGSTPKMAEALNVSQPVVWRVLNEKQSPSGTFLVALSGILDLDLNWVLRGKGDPGQGGKEMGLPIARKLLTGKPQSCREELSEESFVPPAGYYRSSCYWFEVQHADPVTRCPHRKIECGDLLLMETDRRKFPREEHLRDLCGVRLQGAEDSGVTLAYVDFVPGDPEEGPAHLEVDIFDRPIPKSQVIRKLVITERPGKRPVVQRKLYAATESGEVPLSRIQPGTRRHEIGFKDVLSVCVLLLRRRLSDHIELTMSPKSIASTRR